ncbi:NAD(P)/FAD-dependent oxidoreductase [Ruegeria conchae]|uniref:Glycine/D-amino acid oxidase-like deaminating enzyme n=1 Tax=Ruegeria conchae TaxID=981384 RepID=A0A497ZBM0_9RHOB|nr:FAD-binding oxidoreductase [Ruegeria conchae]RLK02626.1 glycine/D-amino acid oxidase-like deaminating enzyme [Ruegeria conchae]
MPGPSPTPVESDITLPKSVDVVVIGGGIIGVSTALELAERGISVLLCEKGRIAGEQSSRNWGWVRLGMRDPREIPLMQEALRIWRGLDERLGRSTGYVQSGIVFGASGTRDVGNLTRWLEHVEGQQTGARMVSHTELASLFPNSTMKPQSGLYMPQDGRAEPQWAAPAMAEAARNCGAAIMTQCAVRSVDLEAGRIAGVFTERGRVRCSQVVLAGGAWSRLFAGNAGIALPQLKVLNTVMRTSPVESGPEVSLWSDDFAIRKRADGGYTIASGHENTVDIVPDSFRLGLRFLPAFRQEWRSLRFRLSQRWIVEAKEDRTWLPTDVTPFEHCRVLDPEPSRKVLRQAWSNARKAMPVLEEAEIVQSWAGLIDVTPDAIPVISKVDEFPGLHIATGFSGHGFGIGPGAGRLMADIVTDSTPCVDPAAFRLSRFTDGSKVRPDPGY